MLNETVLKAHQCYQGVFKATSRYISNIEHIPLTQEAANCGRTEKEDTFVHHPRHHLTLGRVEVVGLLIFGIELASACLVNLRPGGSLGNKLLLFERNRN